MVLPVNIYGVVVHCLGGGGGSGFEILEKILMNILPWKTRYKISPTGNLLFTSCSWLFLLEMYFLLAVFFFLLATHFSHSHHTSYLQFAFLACNLLFLLATTFLNLEVAFQTHNSLFRLTTFSLYSQLTFWTCNLLFLLATCFLVWQLAF